MRRLISYLNSLFLGVILGMIAVAIAQPTHGSEGVRANGIVITYQMVGTKQEKTIHLFAGSSVLFVDSPSALCGHTVDRCYRLSSPILALSISPLRPAILRQACATRK